MKTYSKFLTEGRAINTDEMEKLILPIILGKTDSFNWSVYFRFKPYDDNSNETYEFGTGDFYTCIKNVKKLANKAQKEYPNSIVESVVYPCSTESGDYCLYVAYDPKTMKYLTEKGHFE